MAARRGHQHRLPFIYDGLPGFASDGQQEFEREDTSNP
jgi:hypothetical protein